MNYIALKKTEPKHLGENPFFPEALASVMKEGDPRPTVVFLCGTEGSNRVHWRPWYDYMNRQDDMAFVSQNKHRIFVKDRHNITYTATYVEPYDDEVYESMKKDIKNRISYGRSFIIESPNISNKMRKEFLDLFEGTDYRKQAIVCFGDDNRIHRKYSDRRRRLSKENNDHEFAPPYFSENIIADQSQLFRKIPSAREGFDDVRIISPEGRVISEEESRELKHRREDALSSSLGRG